MKKVFIYWLAHPPDSRIFYKQAKSLSKKFDVTCLWGSFYEKKWNWTAYGFKNIWISWNRLLVLFKAWWYWIVNKSEIYVAHDIDSYLVVVWIKLFKWNAKIIFDSHEFYDEMWKDKQYKFSHRFFYFIFSKLLKPITIRLFEWITVINDFMNHYYKWNKKKEVIHNFPLTDLLDKETKLLDKEKYNDKFILIYQWWLTKVRGILEYVKILNALKNDISNVYLILVWWFRDSNYEKEVKSYIEKNNLNNYVEFIWQIPMDEVYAYDKIAHIWLNLLESNFNHDNWIQVKMFEYLYLELPSIWTKTTKYFNKFIVYNGCWEVIDSIENIDQWVVQIKKIKEGFEQYKNSCERIKNDYIWENEEKKLLDFYEKI